MLFFFFFLFLCRTIFSPVICEGSIFVQGGVEGDEEEIMSWREGRARLCAWGVPVKYLNVL